MTVTIIEIRYIRPIDLVFNITDLYASSDNTLGKNEYPCRLIDFSSVNETINTNRNGSKQIAVYEAIIVFNIVFHLYEIDFADSLFEDNIFIAAPS
ncbi:MAG: hypothetical protein ABFD25_20405 [Clostridiaceae bacterium]